jgi:hypothetical protein
LAPVDGSQYENPLESYAEEIERTRQALVGQRLLARTEPLRTVLLDPLNTLSELHAFLPANLRRISSAKASSAASCSTRSTAAFPAG